MINYSVRHFQLTRDVINESSDFRWFKNGKQCTREQYSDGQTDRQTVKETGRQTDRDTERRERAEEESRAVKMAGHGREFNGKQGKSK